MQIVYPHYYVRIQDEIIEIRCTISSKIFLFRFCALYVSEYCFSLHSLKKRIEFVF